MKIIKEFIKLVGILTLMIVYPFIFSYSQNKDSISIRDLFLNDSSYYEWDSVKNKVTSLQNYINDYDPLELNSIHPSLDTAYIYISEIAVSAIVGQISYESLCKYFIYNDKEQTFYLFYPISNSSCKDEASNQISFFVAYDKERKKTSTCYTIHPYKIMRMVGDYGYTEEAYRFKFYLFDKTRQRENKYIFNKQFFSETGFLKDSLIMTLDFTLPMFIHFNKLLLSNVKENYFVESVKLEKVPSLFKGQRINYIYTNIGNAK